MRRLAILCSLLCLAWTASSRADQVLVEAESFAQPGGWVLDTQFINNMGSPYLLAHGLGQPVEDATTVVRFPSTGEYRVWVRTKDWVARWQAPGQPGRFQLLVDGQPLSETFGTQSADWFWHDGGVVQIKQPDVKLALHDLTGFDGRCDAVFFTSDANVTPPNGAEILPSWRRDLLGLADKPTELAGYDLVVAGGGYSGLGAAISAARMGCKVALIQDRPVLGGNASDELGVGICGASVSHPNARESGIMEEAGRHKAYFHHQRMSEGFRIVAEEEKQLRIFYNRRVIAATMHDPQRIAAVVAVDTLSGQASEFRGKMFIDSTGDGWVGYYAGAKYRLGRESREEFGEDLAPPQADKITMSGCIMGNYTVSFRAKRVGRPVEYVPPRVGRTNMGGDSMGGKQRSLTRFHDQELLDANIAGLVMRLEEFDKPFIDIDGKSVIVKIDGEMNSPRKEAQLKKFLEIAENIVDMVVQQR